MAEYTYINTNMDIILKCVKIVWDCLYYYYYYYYLTANWVDTRWRQYSTHLHTNSTQNTEDGAHITIRKKKNWEVNWE
jgi:hypothetical protein